MDVYSFNIFTLHAQCELGKVGRCWCPYTYACGPKKYFESYFSNRLTFLNIRGTNSTTAHSRLKSRMSLLGERSKPHTGGRSIEITRDIYVYDCLWENNTKKLYAKTRGGNYVFQTCACSKPILGVRNEVQIITCAWNF